MRLTRGVGLALGLVAGACSGSRTPSDRGGGAADSQTASRTADSAARSAESPWHIAPGRSAGPVTPASSETELQRHYGKQAVTPIRVELGEGETTPGTVLFADDSARRLEIVWHDTVTRSRPARLILRGRKTEWKVGPDISLGTTLLELERLNGRPFTLAGFGWDYAGVITEWGGGTLDRALAGVKLYVDPGPEQYQSAAYSQVLGDRDYSSSLTPMQQLNPRVAQIFVDFE